MAFRGRGGPRRGRGMGMHRNDPPLISLVEEYLMENKHLSFVNLENMGEVIRRKSFRFARMQMNVFREQLKRAYEIYSHSTTKAQNDFSGANIELDNTPLTDETLKEMEGYPVDSSDSDDDLLIDEQPPQVPQDKGANQMKDLYKTQTPNSASHKAQQQPGVSHKNAAASHPTADGSVGPRSDDSNNVITIGDKDGTECLSIGSSTDVSTKSQNVNLGSESQGALRIGTDTLQLDEEDFGSDTDLEIIGEVKNETSNSSNNSGKPRVADIVNGVTPSGPLSNLPLQTTKQQGTSRMPSASSHTGPSGFLILTPTTQKLATPVRFGGNGFDSKGLDRSLKRKTPGKKDEDVSSMNEDFSRKRAKKEVPVTHDTGYKLKDFAGSEKVVEEICRLLMHLKHPEIYTTLGVTPPRGFLLHGPPGTGKTLLANCIAGELQMPMLKVAGTELVSGISGESESNIRELFNQAVTIAPCIVFIDEIDSVTPRRENVNKEMERRIVAQLLSCIDDLVNKEKGSQVLLIGATNRIEAIDTALRRAGRFDREICLGIPDEKSREQILSVICRDLKLEADFQLSRLARLTPGYVGADLQALIREAAIQAVNRSLSLSANILPTETMQTDSDSNANVASEMDVDDEIDDEKKPDKNDKLDNQRGQQQESESGKLSVESQKLSATTPMRWIKGSAPLSPEQLQNLFVTLVDFELALKTVQPSSKREGFATVPDITWDDIGALRDVRDELQVSILGPVKYAEAFKRLGLTTPAGVLLCGPPGCGKTLLAKAVANEAGINFISVKGPELLNMYVGESERAVRQCFLRARNSCPCVIFFDELDALCPRRSDVAESGSTGRIVNQLLTEMDGMEGRKGVFIMAATNRPDIIDPAVLRPGRLDKILFVNLPSNKDRLEILRAITKNSTIPVLAEDVNLEEIANRPECEEYTGADLSALVREAAVAAFRELVLLPNIERSDPVSTEELKVYNRHFTTAFTKTKPSVNKEDRCKYKVMAEKYSTVR